MALYLQHEPLTVLRRKELLSSAVSTGTIQLLPDGHLLILMSDHQTTGGYPRVGHVASAHLPALAQRAASEVIRFRKITAVESENMLLSLRQQMQALQRACLDRLTRYYADH
jgi:antagonist of KipI